MAKLGTDYLLRETWHPEKRSGAEAAIIQHHPDRPYKIQFFDIDLCGWIRGIEVDTLELARLICKLYCDWHDEAYVLNEDAALWVMDYA